eukprot:3447232-Rhodomonas_salina.2
MLVGLMFGKGREGLVVDAEVIGRELDVLVEKSPSVSINVKVPSTNSTFGIVDREPGPGVESVQTLHEALHAFGSAGKEAALAVVNKS